MTIYLCLVLASCTALASLSYHYSLSDVESHKGPAFTYACLAAESLLSSEEFDVILPYMEAALKSVSTGRQRWRLYRLLGRTIRAMSRKRHNGRALVGVVLRPLYENLREMREFISTDFISRFLPYCFAKSVSGRYDSPTLKYSSKVHCES